MTPTYGRAHHWSCHDCDMEEFLSDAAAIIHLRNVHGFTVDQAKLILKWLEIA